MELTEIIANLSDLIPDAVAIGHRASRNDPLQIVWVNGAFRALFGARDGADWVGTLALSLAETGDLDALAADVLHDRAPLRDHPLGLVRADGTRFPGLVGITPLPGPQGDPEGDHVILSLRARPGDAHGTPDLNADTDTMDPAAIRALKSAHKRLLDAFNALPEPFVIYGKDNRIVTCNDAYRRAMADAPDDIRPGMPVAAMLQQAVWQGHLDPGTQEPGDYVKDLLRHRHDPIRDIQTSNNTHYRVFRCHTASDDTVMYRFNTTELVQQRKELERARARLLGALNAYPAPFCIYDSDGRLVVWNASYVDTLTDDPSEIQEGMTLEAVKRVGLKNRRFADAWGREEEWLRETLRASFAFEPVEDMLLFDGRQQRVLRSRAENGDLVMVRIEMTQLLAQRRALQKAQDRMMSAINAFPDPFAIFDKEDRLVIWNPAYEKSFGAFATHIQAGVSLRELLELGLKSGAFAVEEGTREAWIETFLDRAKNRIRHEDVEGANDTHFHVLRSWTDAGEMTVLRLNMTEVVRQRRVVETYAKKLEAINREMSHKATHDDLTGLGNRRYLETMLAKSAAIRAQTGCDVAALQIDLDRFKQINDTIGHSAGDYVLKDVAHRILRLLREGEHAARIGGDEFVVLLGFEPGSKRPEVLAEALLSDLQSPCFFEGTECRYGASIGVSKTPISPVEDLITHADVALYKAKNGGRARVCRFDQSDLDDLRRNKSVADDIMRALERSEFFPVYQPQIDVKTGRLVGLEALARWQHPERGVLGPNGFIDIATDLNVMADIDRLIFEKAIEECSHHFQGHRDVPSVSFNVSAKRLQSQDIVEIGHLAKQYPGEVAFELLETIFLDDADSVYLMKLDALREMGVSIEVDDFGSGHASIIALQRIGPDRLKIDRRIIAPIEEQDPAVQLVRSIVQIGRALSMEVTAEGVETAEQARILSELGCDRLQGYYFSRPVPLDALPWSDAMPLVG